MTNCWQKCLFYYLRFGYLSSHFQYNKQSRTKKKQILKPNKTLEIEAITNYFQFNKIHNQT